MIAVVSSGVLHRAEVALPLCWRVGVQECTLLACCIMACDEPKDFPFQSLQVLLLAPQLVGYARIACLAAAVAAGPRHPALCATLSLLNFALDALDGHLARRWRQATAFGALLDVLIDNVSRAVLWAGALNGPAGIAVPLLDMTVFACTHAVRHHKVIRDAVRCLQQPACICRQHEDWGAAHAPSLQPAIGMRAGLDDSVSSQHAGRRRGVEGRLLPGRAGVGAPRDGGQLPDAAGRLGRRGPHGRTAVALVPQVHVLVNRSIQIYTCAICTMSELPGRTHIPANRAHVSLRWQPQAAVALVDTA